jgi:aryl sulfotransferase
MYTEKPSVHHIYQNHTLDSTRWDHFRPRPGDTVIATPLRSGTTWTQILVMHLIFQDLKPRPVDQLSPWFERRWGEPVADVLERLEGQQHRRFIKTHLPLDGLPYFDEVKYIVVSRDARDVFMSLWDFYRNFEDSWYEWINRDWAGRPFPRCPESITDFWRGWIGKGWFDWDSEGYPFWANLRHVQSWWNFKHMPNILFVHFNDLLDNLEREIQRIADFLGIDVAPDLRAKIAEAAAFRQVKGNADLLGHRQSFFYRGTNGRWRGVLSDEDLRLYHAAVARELSPDCARWLENGRSSGLQSRKGDSSG